jgi:hypothetical protein
MLKRVLFFVYGVTAYSLMARPWFKDWWTRFVPRPIERSTYVLLSSLALIALFALWRPMGGAVWSVDDASGRLALRALFGFGCQRASRSPPGLPERAAGPSRTSRPRAAAAV